MIRTVGMKKKWMVALVSDRALSILVHGHSKVGKSTFSVSTPVPRLYLDVESASRFLPITKVVWDPAREQPPVYDGTWDTCVVYVREYQTVMQVYAWLNSGQHPFKSVILDSVSELQVRCLDQIAGRDKVQTQHWGDMLRNMGGLLRDLRDLTMHPTNPQEAVVLTAMTRNIDGMYRPHLQGQMASTIPYLYDICAYLYVEQIPQEDPSLPPIEVRRLLTRKHPMFEAGERVQGRLPMVVDHPNISTMLDTIFGPAEGTTGETLV